MRRAEEIIAEELALAPELRPIFAALVAARRAVLERIRELDTQLRATARSSRIVRLFMTAPGIGPITALAVATAFDDASRFSRSSSAGAYLGLTPKRYESGETSQNGRISKRGDRMTRTCLYEAANALLTRNIGGSGCATGRSRSPKEPAHARRKSRWRASWRSCSMRCGGPGSRSRSGAPHDVHQHLGGVWLITRTLDEMRPAGTYGRTRSLRRLRPLRLTAHTTSIRPIPNANVRRPCGDRGENPGTRRTDRGGPSLLTKAIRERPGTRPSCVRSDRSYVRSDRRTLIRTRRTLSRAGRPFSRTRRTDAARQLGANTAEEKPPEATSDAIHGRRRFRPSGASGLAHRTAGRNKGGRGLGGCSTVAASCLDARNGKPRSVASSDDHSAPPDQERGSAGRSVARRLPPRERSLYRSPTLSITVADRHFDFERPHEHSAAANGRSRHVVTACHAGSRRGPLQRRRSSAPSRPARRQVERRGRRISSARRDQRSPAAAQLVQTSISWHAMLA